MLFELRPDSLVQTELAKLLQQLADSLAARTSAEIVVVAGPLIHPLPPEVKVTFYRVAQEALGNAVKHAHAAAIAVILEADDSRVELTVKDDGDGFDGDAITTAGLGLSNMRERAQAPGFDLNVDSQPGRGTRIRLAWREPHAG